MAISRMSMSKQVSTGRKIKKSKKTKNPYKQIKRGRRKK
tara:strand:- start:573 stop:689 length:117 start_codon:yes stop_codon:yes gene_type:complete